jgi:hypothetical protein
MWKRYYAHIVLTPVLIFVYFNGIGLSFQQMFILIHLKMLRTSPKGCLKHHGHKGDPRVTPGTCGAGGEKAQVILVWVRAPGVGNASHPRGLGVMRIRP